MPDDIIDPTSADDIAPVDQQEDESDLSEEVVGDLGQSVLFNTDWTVATIIEQIRKGNILLDPQFQRRNAWDHTRKSRLVESLIIGLPIPNIVLAEQKGAKGKFIVIDGKQRLVSLLEFTEKELPLGDLTLRRNLEGKRYSDLKSDPALADDLTAFENQTIRTIVIRNWPSEKFLYVIFYRLNSGSLPLSPQELRKAIYPGEFLNYIDDYLSTSTLTNSVLGQKTPDRRMRDAELVLRYIAFELNYPEYGGNFKVFLDNTVRFFNENWTERKELADKILEDFNRSIDISLKVFDRTEVFHKWNGARFENRINRAVFDVITRYFSNAEIESLIVEKREEIRESFQEICVNNPEFKRSIELTTKSPFATSTRLKIWGKLLAQIIGRQFDEGTFRVI